MTKDGVMAMMMAAEAEAAVLVVDDLVEAMMIR